MYVCVAYMYIHTYIHVHGLCYHQGGRGSFSLDIVVKSNVIIFCCIPKHIYRKLQHFLGICMYNARFYIQVH